MLTLLGCSAIGIAGWIVSAPLKSTRVAEGRLKQSWHPPKPTEIQPTRRQRVTARNDAAKDSKNAEMRMFEQSIDTKVVHSVVHIILRSSRPSVAHEAPHIAHKMGSRDDGSSVLKSGLAIYRLRGPYFAVFPEVTPILQPSSKFVRYTRHFADASLLTEFLHESPANYGVRAIPGLVPRKPRK